MHSAGLYIAESVLEGRWEGGQNISSARRICGNGNKGETERIKVSAEEVRGIERRLWVMMDQKMKDKDVSEKRRGSRAEAKWVTGPLAA